MKQNRKKYKLKRHSCQVCKPHKMGWSDKRKISQKREDEKNIIDEGREE